MANLYAIHSVGASLATWMRNRYPAELRAAMPCAFRVLSSGDLAQLDESPGNATVGIYLHRLTINEQGRHHRASGASSDAVPPLALDLHLLITISADGALAEHTVAGWVMRELHERPLFDRSVLSTDAGWRADELVHVIPAELGHEDLSRVWESFRRTYRLTLPYVARVVRLDPSTTPDGAPVVAIRQGLGPIEVVR